MLCKIRFTLHSLLVLLLLTDGPCLTYHCLVTKVMTIWNKEYLQWVLIVETVSVLTVMILWFKRLAARLAITTSQHPAVTIAISDLHCQLLSMEKPAGDCEWLHNYGTMQPRRICLATTGTDGIIVVSWHCHVPCNNIA